MKDAQAQQPGSMSTDRGEPGIEKSPVRSIPNSRPTPARPVVELAYASGEGVPALALARITVLAMTVYAGLTVLAAAGSAASLFWLAGAASMAIFHAAPMFIAALPVVIVGVIALTRRGPWNGFVGALLVHVGLRVLGMLITFGATVWSLVSSGATGIGRSPGYLLMNSIAQVGYALAMLVPPLLALWILRRPEIRGNQ